jgi:hypothetical protein
MPGVCQVCAAGRHRMPPSDVPHKTSTQLQWYLISVLSCNAWLPNVVKECACIVCVFLWHDFN